IPELIVQKNVKDIQFHSSYKLVIGLVMFPLYYIIVYFFMTIFIDSWWIRLAYVSVLPVSGVIAFEFMTFHRKIFAKLRYNLLVSKGNSKIISLKKLHDEIIKEVDEIVDRKLLMSDANTAAVKV
ncbi:MAG: hypothetical protein K9J13_12955, partial [Saprospiraceae bacterium]|nr:hypothetical protein [Saprospiraceae bacterium]